MALSVLSSQSSYSDLQTFFDLSGPTNDLTSFDLMEYNNHSNLIQNSANIRSFNDGTNNIIHSNPNFHDYDNVISFVDSPPNSKESWPEEQPTSYHLKPVIIDIQTIYSQGINRKRRMDWDSLDINQSANNTATSQPTSSKVPNLNNGTNNNNNSVHKELDKKRLSGRGSWTDDIDFDLNGEFSNNVYLNNESFLSFSPTLSGLKQEIPSPQTEIAKGNQSPHSNTKSKTNKILNSPEITTNINKDHQQQSNPIQKSSNNEVSVGSPQPVLQTHAGATATFNDGPTANGIKIDLVNGYQSIIPDKNLENNKSACNSPLQIIESSKTEHGADDYKFQYILAAATSTATKNNEEALTYLNQGQSYEIKLKKTGDLSFYRDKILKSVIKICFHERRLQYMEREQMQLWQSSRPGERIIEVDVPLSYGLCHVVQPLNSNFSNTVEVHWDPMKEIGVYIKVNCISTEFTPKKHGGEKGVPFRLQIETYIENANNINSNNNNNINNNNNNNNTNNNNNNNNTINGNGNGNGACGNGGIAGDAGGGLTNLSVNNIIGSKPIHAAACQIKVFKLKGADRKHKQDREKIQRRPLSEQDKYQPSYECTILNDISLESITLPPTTGCYSPEYLKIWPNSPVHIPKYDGVLPFVPAVTANSSPIAINSVTSTNTKAMDSNMLSPQQVDIDDGLVNISQDSSPSQVSQWLTYHRLNTYISTFVHFSGSDILRMSKEDLIQICGLADGIRMFNILHAKAILPRLTIYLTLDGTKYNAIYLYSNSVKELTQKMFKIPGFYEFCANISNMNGNADGGYSGWGMNSKYSGSGSNIYNDASKFGIFTTGPSGVHVMVTDEVLNNEIKDDGLYALNVQNGKVLIKSINKNE